ncbi:serine phosphatase [Reinekea sp. MED297]|uniref:Serine phosphatase n=1 Tax=Reinekea blandensis MED297 TaxID=314283 RepID=A4BH99_9GAMM|nr:serine phosphatase [Reinekea sp. MED297] [Reinekea blandensis MED297]
MSFQVKVALGSLIAIVLVWSVLAVLSFTATNALIDSTSRKLYAAHANELTLQVQATYEPLVLNTALLSEHRLATANTFAERMQSVPMLMSVLRQAPQTTAILAGYENGDHFMLRMFRNDELRTRLNAPSNAVFAIDHSYGDRRETPFRQFLDADMNLIQQQDLPDYRFDPRTRPWYLSAQKSNGVVSTDPYVFFSSREIGITIAMHSPDKKAVLALDVALSSVSDYLSRQRITENTEVVLRNQNGMVAWSGNASLVMSADTLRQRRLDDIDREPFRSLADGSAPTDWLIHREPMNLVFGDDMEMLIAVPKDEFLVELRQTRNRILFYSFTILALLVPMAWVLSNRLAGPIRELYAAVSKVDKQTFELELPPVRSNDEIGALNRALLAMSEALQHYIVDLEAATVAKQKLESEMEIARRIQMELVPGGGELEKTNNHGEIYAHLIPARAVGGDLYEVLKLADGRYFIAVGDVSGKGMPAALFMSRAVALTKMMAPTAPSAGAFLSRLNDELVKNNESCMFITMLCGFYDAQTGKFQCANAGHNPPVLTKEQSSEFLHLESGSALGVFEDNEFPDQTIALESKQQLFIYTDGITEAFDMEQREFSDERLLAALSDDNVQPSAPEQATSVIRDVEAFAAGAPQSDDITVVVMRRR